MTPIHPSKIKKWSVVLVESRMFSPSCGEKGFSLAILWKYDKQTKHVMFQFEEISVLWDEAKNYKFYLIDKEPCL